MANGIDWFRWHHGSVSDPKFGLVAKRAGVKVADVIAVWAVALESASASDDRGLLPELDYESIDYMLGFDEGVTARILDAIAQRGMIVDGGRIAAWEKRQPKRERVDDGSTDRSRAFRERQRQSAADAATQRHATPETDGETPCNAAQRSETPRVEKRREDQNQKLGGSSADADPSEKPTSAAELVESSKAERLAAVTRQAVQEFNRTLSKQGGGLLAAVTLPDSDTRRQQVRRMLKIGRAICERMYGEPIIGAKFWEDYWATVAADPFLNGTGPYTNGHANWQPDFEYLTRPQTVEKVLDKAMGASA